MNRFGTFAPNRQNGFVALTNCFFVRAGYDIFAGAADGRGGRSAHVFRQLFALWRERRRGPSRRLQPRPAGETRLPQSGRAGLPELAALLRQGLCATRLLQPRLIYRPRAGGGARPGLTCRRTLLRCAGGRTCLPGRASWSLPRPRRLTWQRRTAPLSGQPAGLTRLAWLTLARLTLPPATLLRRAGLLALP